MEVHMVPATTRLLGLLTAAGFLSLMACDAGSFVTDPIVPDDARVSLSPSELTLGVGESARITATVVRQNGDPVNPRCLKWASTDPSRATVDGEGLVMGVAPGYSSIIASCGQAADTTRVRVVEGAGVRILAAPDTLRGIGASFTMTAEARAEDGSIVSDPGITWASSNPHVIQVDDMGGLTAIALGQAIIAASAACCPGDSVEATVVPAAAVGTTEFPNMPAGMTLIGGTDGSVLGGVHTTATDGQPAFGVPGFNHWSEISSTCRAKESWPEHHIMHVNDPLNPTGSGRAIRLYVDENGCGGTATTNRDFGAYEELYFKWSLFLEHDRDRNIKMMYVAGESKGVSDSHFSLMSHGGLHMLSTATLRWLQVPSVFIVGEWVTVEAHLVTESVAGKNDGQMHIWVNGEHRQSFNDVQWHREGDSRLFDKLQWYAHHSNRGWSMSYRIGEFHVAGR
jgi:hypothetical protein